MGTIRKDGVEEFSGAGYTNVKIYMRRGGNPRGLIDDLLGLIFCLLERTIGGSEDRTISTCSV